MSEKNNVFYFLSYVVPYILSKFFIILKIQHFFSLHVPQRRNPRSSLQAQLMIVCFSALLLPSTIVSYIPLLLRIHMKK